LIASGFISIDFEIDLIVPSKGLIPDG
jgi:hypothetical protein